MALSATLPTRADAQALVPPTLLDGPPAAYPPAALEAGREADVELRVVVDVDGSVREPEVASSGGADFDAAAIEAVARWRFSPATRDGTPVAARIRIPFQFRLPSVEPVESSGSGAEDEGGAPPSGDASSDEDDLSAPADASGGDEAANGAPSAGEGTGAPDEGAATPSRDAADPDTSPGDREEPDAETDDDDAIHVTVRGEREAREEVRSAGDIRVSRDVIAAAPRSEGAEVLRSAPGLYIGRAGGLAVAHSYSLRGFDAEHGQDISFHVGGLPINLPMHIHGQGYADLGFLLGDVVLGLDVSEGVYDPRQGDFAVAGSIDVRLGVGVNDRGIFGRSSVGSFGTFRQVMVYAPEDAPEASFGAAQYTRTSGFGQNRRGQSGSAIVQHEFSGDVFDHRIVGLLHTSRADMAGVVRRDDIAAGRVCFHCVYDLPTAEAQSALSSRFMLGYFAERHGDDGASSGLGFWMGYDAFRIQRNLTGFIESSTTLERVAGRGDLIEQQNRTLSFGLSGHHRTAPYRPWSWLSARVELGIDGRFDIVEQSQNLLAIPRNEVWDMRVDAGIRGIDIGLYADIDAALTQYARLRIGARADVLTYDIDDRLGNFVPTTRNDENTLPGFRRSATGVAAGPRISLEGTPNELVTLLVAYGEGYRSPQARTLDDGELAPFTKVRSADVGVRLGWDGRHELALSAYYTHLSDDIAFDAVEGRLERIGASRRLGLVLHGVARPWPWMVASGSLTYVDASLLEPPPPTREEPAPPFEEGQNLPFVPPVVARADIGVRHPIVADLGGAPLMGRGGLGFSALSRRPLPFGAFSAPVALLDMSAGVSWRALDLGLEVFNVTGQDYAAIEYNFASDWQPEDGFRSRTPARHIAAGAPRAFMVSLGVHL